MEKHRRRSLPNDSRVPSVSQPFNSLHIQTLTSSSDNGSRVGATVLGRSVGDFVGDILGWSVGCGVSNSTSLSPTDSEGDIVGCLVHFFDEEVEDLLSLLDFLEDFLEDLSDLSDFLEDFLEDDGEDSDCLVDLYEETDFEEEDDFEDFDCFDLLDFPDLDLLESCSVGATVGLAVVFDDLITWGAEVAIDVPDDDDDDDELEEELLELFFEDFDRRSCSPQVKTGISVPPTFHASSASMLLSSGAEFDEDLLCLDFFIRRFKVYPCLMFCELDTYLSPKVLSLARKAF